MMLFWYTIYEQDNFVIFFPELFNTSSSNEVPQIAEQILFLLEIPENETKIVTPSEKSLNVRGGVIKFNLETSESLWIKLFIQFNYLKYLE